MLRAYLRQSLEAIRRRGYAMAADGPAMKSVWQAIWEHAANTQNEKYWAQMHRLLGALSTDEFQLLTLDRIRTFRLAYISAPVRSEEHTYALQSLMRISYAVFFL